MRKKVRVPIARGVLRFGRAADVELIERLLTDLEAESAVLDALLRDLEPHEWSTPTPAKGWSIADQITHLAFFDETATLAASDEAAFIESARSLESRGPNFSAWVAEEHRTMAPRAIHEWFATARGTFLRVLSQVDPQKRLPWYGPPMSPASSITARLMETWAHGQDVAQATSSSYPQSMRLEHVAYLGVRTFGFSFRAHGLQIPKVPVWIDLEAPDGSRWAWGEVDASETVVGKALDFCLVVTQRKAVEATDLLVEGAVASEWMQIAQAFAGPPTTATR